MSDTTNTPLIQTINELTPEQIDLIKKTVAKGATDDELKLFLYQCNQLGLSALSKQVHFVKYGNGPGTVIIGVDGFRVIAHRTGKLSGIKRGSIKDDKGKLIGGWAEVYRTDWIHPAREEAPLNEYVKATPNWKTMPETMIKKIAEVAALRMAFPMVFSGVYAHEEMPDPPKEKKPRPTTCVHTWKLGDGLTEDDCQFKFCTKCGEEVVGPKPGAKSGK